MHTTTSQKHTHLSRVLSKELDHTMAQLFGVTENTSHDICLEVALLKDSTLTLILQEAQKTTYTYNAQCIEAARKRTRRHLTHAIGNFARTIYVAHYANPNHHQLTSTSIANALCIKIRADALVAYELSTLKSPLASFTGQALRERIENLLDPFKY